MAGLKGACLLVLGLNLPHLSIASAVQQPLLDASQQASLTPSSGKPLVDTETLQAAISADRLLARAKDLFEIAELSHDDYNRPTRVIGSKGELIRSIEAPRAQKGHLSLHRP